MIEFSHDDHLLVLDGRVLEYFHLPVPWQSQRIPVAHVAVYQEGPDRRGRTVFRFQPLAVDFHALKIKLPAERVDEMARFIAACRQARDSTS